MDDKLQKQLGAINDPFVKEMKKLQEALAPSKAIQEALENMAKMSQFDIPRQIFEVPRPPSLPRDQNLASEFHKRLQKWISDFEQALDQKHEVGARLVSFGQSVTFHLENIGYWNPSLISFSGFTDDGEPVELIQHVSQISILLVRVKRSDPLKPKRPIGFASWPGENTRE